MLNSSKSCRSNPFSVEPCKNYKQLSPKLGHARSQMSDQIIDLIQCNNYVLPNMELRKSLFKTFKITSKKDNIYSRNLRWYQKKVEKLREKR